MSKVFGYHKNIKALFYLFGNKYSTMVLKNVFKIVPSVQFIVAPTGYNKSKNHFKHTAEINKIFMPNQVIVQSVTAIFSEIRITHQIIVGFVWFRFSGLHNRTTFYFFRLGILLWKQAFVFYRRSCKSDY